MEKVLVDVEVIKGILNAYQRANDNQVRIYGIILGNQKNNIYYITEAIYGIIFVEKNQKTKEIEFMRLNDQILFSMLNSYQRKSKSTNSLNRNNTQIKFKADETLMILGGFATDKELFSDLHKLYSTIDNIKYNIQNANKILLLVDPNYKDDNKVNYGIKTYNWLFKSFKINDKESKALLYCKEIENQIIKHINNLDLLGVIKNQNLWNKLYNLKIDKNDSKNINELLENLEDNDDNIISEDNNINFIKNKVKDCMIYLDIFEKMLENEEKEGEINNDDLNKVAYILSHLDKILNDNEIIDMINKDIDKKYNISALTQLLEVQLTLSDKIRKLIV